MITRENYEIYFIDYLEGELSNEDINRVEVFLEENKDLKEEFELISSEELRLNESEEPAMDFSFLKKEAIINEENEDDFFIGRIEKDLSKDQEKLLTLYLKENPSKKEKMQTYQKTVLFAEAVSFPNKRRLKKTRSIGVYYKMTIGIAAAMLILFYINIQLDGLKLQPASFADKSNTNLPKMEQIVESISDNSLAEISEVKIPVTYSNIKTRVVPTVSQNLIDTSTSRVMEITKVNEAKGEILDLNKEVITSPDPLKIDFEDKVLANNTPLPRKSLTPIEFVKEKSTDYASKKTGTEIKSGGDLLSFASSTVKLPKFIKVEEKKEKNGDVKTYKIGRLIKITRKN